MHAYALSIPCNAVLQRRFFMFKFYYVSSGIARITGANMCCVELFISEPELRKVKTDYHAEKPSDGVGCAY